MPYGARHIPEDKLAEMLDDLKLHFGEPVRPVSEYCDAFREWHRAIREKVEGTDWRVNTIRYDFDLWKEIVAALDRLVIPIAKSNYLWRLIYGDGLKRTEKCPVHKGVWSGYAWDRACEYGCQHGYDQTGWLPEPHVYTQPPPDREAERDESGRVTRAGVRYVQDRCYACGGTLEKGRHIEPEEAGQLPYG
jgi:hypothetical protein